MERRNHSHIDKNTNEKQKNFEEKKHVTNDISLFMGKHISFNSDFNTIYWYMILQNDLVLIYR